MDIKISCIIPYYNIDKELLFQCVDSILKQDFQEYEIIIVDDGSEDSYKEILCEVCHLDNRIQIINQKKAGVSSARNLGVKNAKGEYVTFVDADDLIVPYFFSEAYQVAAENDADYVIGGILASLTRTPEIIRIQKPDIEIRDSVQYIPFAIEIIDKFPGGGHFNRGPVAKLIKRTILANFLFQENLGLGEDIIWNLDVTSKCDKIFMVYQIWYIYWKNPRSITHAYNKQMIPLCEKSLEELIQRIDLENEKEAVAVSSRIYECLKHYIYYCYLGHRECPMPIIKRFRIFREVCQREPWTEYSNELFLKNCSNKEKIKQLLVKSGIIYWYWFAKDVFRKNKQR